MIVHKFGGTSVGDAERFSGVADILIEKHGLENGAAACDAVVVLSAMSGATNQLIAGARAEIEAAGLKRVETQTFTLETL